MQKKIVLRIILYIIVGVMIGYFYVRPIEYNTENKKLNEMCESLSQDECINSNMCYYTHTGGKKRGENTDYKCALKLVDPSSILK